MVLVLFRNLLDSSSHAIVRLEIVLNSDTRRTRHPPNYAPRGKLKGAPEPMLQPSDSQKSQSTSNQNFAPARAVSVPVEQATIGRSLVIKGEISGSESLYIDGKVEGTINFADTA